MNSKNFIYVKYIIYLDKKGRVKLWVGAIRPCEVCKSVKDKTKFKKGRVWGNF